MSAKLLHVTNGDGAAERIRAAGFTGDILPWRDVLHEGPVPGRLGPAQLREVRATFLAERWGDQPFILKDMEERDEKLAACSEFDEVVLWFEHDLYDQLQLIQILQRIDAQGNLPRRLTLACEAEYLGMLSVDRIRALHTRRQSVGAAHLTLAAAAWAAFGASEASHITMLLDHDTSALPYLAAALRRHLEEFPSARTGLSRSEQQALEAINDGAESMGDAFRRGHHEREDAIFLGDTVFAWYLERMSQVPVALVVQEDGSPVRVQRPGEDGPDYWRRSVRLTEAGRRVLAGDENAIALNGIDRWLGGVHLVAPAGRPFIPPL